MAISAANALTIHADLETAIIAALNADSWLTSSVTEAGDAANQLSAWKIRGQTAANTNAGVLYWTLSNVSTTRTVSLYSDAAKTAKVAEGTSVGDGIVNLAESNSSGIAGLVTVAYTADDTGSGNTLTVGLGRIYEILERYVPADEIALWVDAVPCLMVAVETMGSDPTLGTMGVYSQSVSCTAEYRDIYGDLAAGKDRAQVLCDRLMRWIIDEERTGGKRLNGFMDTADAYVTRRDTRVEESAIDREDGTFSGEYVIACSLEWDMEIRVTH